MLAALRKRANSLGMLDTVEAEGSACNSSLWKKSASATTPEHSVNQADSRQCHLITNSMREEGKDYICPDKKQNNIPAF